MKKNKNILKKMLLSSVGVSLILGSYASIDIADVFAMSNTDSELSSGSQTGDSNSGSDLLLPELDGSTADSEEGLVTLPELDENDSLNNISNAEVMNNVVSVLNIPDENFRKVILENYLLGRPEPAPTVTINPNTPKYDKYNLYSSDLLTIQSITDLDVRSLNISDLTGIEYFKALTKLDCAGNNLISLDLGKNTELVELYCQNNQLKDINFLDRSTNRWIEKLKIIDCSSNNLWFFGAISLDELEWLNCSNNEINQLSIDADWNPNLKYLNIANNKMRTVFNYFFKKLETFILDNNYWTIMQAEFLPKLVELSATDNSLTNIDLSKNPWLKNISLDNQNYNKSRSSQLGYTQRGDGRYEVNLNDLKASPLWEHNIDLNKMIITSVGERIGNKFIFPAGTAPTKFVFDYKTEPVGIPNHYMRNVVFELKKLDAPIGTEYVLEIPDENFRREILVNYLGNRVDPSPALSADSIPKYDNYTLYSTDLANIQAVEDLIVSHRSIESLKGIEYFTNLKFLDCQGNELTELDLTQNTLVKTVYCLNNKITSIDVSQSTDLERLFADENKLTSLDLSNNPKIRVVHVNKNKLATLDVSNNPLLRVLYAEKNLLTDINLSNTVGLEKLTVSENKLTQLNVSDSVVLERLMCSNNDLTSLDLRNNVRLLEVRCNTNGLSSLLFGTHPNLSVLSVQRTKLTTLDLSGLPNLYEARLSENLLTTLDISNNLILDTMFIDNNKLLRLDTSKNAKLKKLVAFRNQLTSYTAINNDSMTELYLNTQTNGPIQVIKEAENRYTVDLNQIRDQLGDTGFDLSKIVVKSPDATIEGNQVVFTTTAQPTELTYVYNVPHKRFNWEMKNVVIKLTSDKLPPTVEYTVEFVDWDNTLISSQKVKHGESAVKPADPYRENYTFMGWDQAFDVVLADMTIKAQYKSNSNSVPPVKPVEPDKPVIPDKPVKPVEPNKPIEPNQPVEENKPIEPNQPLEPSYSNQPDKPMSPNEKDTQETSPTEKTVQPTNPVVDTVKPDKEEVKEEKNEKVEKEEKAEVNQNTDIASNKMCLSALLIFLLGICVNIYNYFDRKKNEKELRSKSENK